jgi:hypothetical protein
MVSQTKRSVDPTPEEIRRRCEEIREGWSENTYYTRAGFQRDPNGRWSFWHIPEYKLSNLLSVPSEADLDSN